MKNMLCRTSSQCILCIVVVCAFLVAPKAPSSDVLPAEKNFSKIVYDGKLKLNLGSDEVFNKIYLLLTNPDNRTKFIYESGGEAGIPGFFFAWDSDGAELSDGDVIEFDRPTLRQLLEEICRRRGKTLIPMKDGFLMLSQPINLGDRETVVSVENQKLSEMLSLSVPQEVSFVNVNSESPVVEYLNKQLLLTKELAGWSSRLVIEEKSQNIDHRGMEATFLGEWRYMNLLHIYGEIFQKQFTVKRVP